MGERRSGSLANMLLERFLALEHENFRYFLAGQSVSLIGTWMQRTAQQWLVYSITDSAFLLGMLGVCQYAPILLFSMPAGVYVDRFPKKKILLITQTMEMAQAVVLAALVWSGFVEYWHVFILAGLLGLAHTFDMPTRQSFYIELVGRDNLKNAIGLNSMIVNIARIIGPAFSGMIMAHYGIAFCFFMNGLSFLAVIFGLIKIKPHTVNIRVKQQQLKDEALDGLKYVRSKKQILYAILAALVIGTFAMNTNVIIPVLAKVVFNQEAQGFSFMVSAMGIGALIGSLFFSVRSRAQSSRDGILFSALLLSASLLLAGATRSYGLVLVFLAAFGAFNIVFMATVNSTIQLAASDEYRGRVMSVYSLVLMGTTPIGNFLTGYVAEHFGPGNSFYFCGTVSILLMVCIYKGFHLIRVPGNAVQRRLETNSSNK